jgi:hypothetical protein
MAFLVVVGLATYAYAAYIFSKEPDPSTQYGFSLNAMLAFLVAMGASLAALAIVLLMGVIGYAVIIVVYPLFFPKIVKKMISGNGKTTA